MSTTTVPLSILLESRISAEALGVLCYLHLHHDATNQQIAKRFRCGRDRVQRIMRELIDSGLIDREAIRDGATGQFVKTVSNIKGSKK